MRINTHLLSFKIAMMPAASAGEKFDEEFGRSVGLDTPKLPGVEGHEELDELMPEGGYHESVDISWGRA